MKTNAHNDRTRWRGAVTLVTAGLVSAFATTAFATPPGKSAAGQESVSVDVMQGNRPAQNVVRPQNPNAIRTNDRNTPGTVAGAAASPMSNRPVTRPDLRPQTQPPRTAPPNARGGGPGPAPQCGQGQPCVAPDLSPSAPQREWDRDPRVPPMHDQNNPGPAPQAMGPQGR